MRHLPHRRARETLVAQHQDSTISPQPPAQRHDVVRGLVGKQRAASVGVMRGTGKLVEPRGDEIPEIEGRGFRTMLRRLFFGGSPRAVWASEDCKTPGNASPPQYPADDRALVIVVNEGTSQMASRQVIRGPFARLGPRFVVSVVDTRRGVPLLATAVNGTEHEAYAIASLMRDDLERLGAEQFLKSSRWATRRR